jgi:hypothetical protein
MAWGEQDGLLDRFESVRSTLDALWPSRKRVGRTYQGLIQAMIRWSPRLLRRIEPHLRTCVRQTCGTLWETGGWVVMGVDGSRVELPRTAANERAFGTAGRGGSGPQAWLTTALHLATGLCWCWKIGKADSDERGHLRRMLGLLPSNALIVADAGYTGYELWKQLIDSGRSILIRVGANVKLLSKLGYEVREHEGIVYLWPDKKRRRNERPLTLRLIRLHDGRKEVVLVTNVLEASKLSDKQAGEFYRWRWGLELWFRAMKQTLDRRKMRSDGSVQAALELRWSVVGLSLLGLLAIRAILQRGADPRRLSPSAALRCVRHAMRQPQRHARRGRGLWAALGRSVQDPYTRRASKAARDWPHKKNEPPAASPKIREASPMEIQAAQELRVKLRAA